MALRALRADQRRQRREQEAFDMQQLTTPDDAWKRIAPVLDEGLERLSETDRNAVLLRFFKWNTERAIDQMTDDRDRVLKLVFLFLFPFPLHTHRRLLAPILHR